MNIDKGRTYVSWQNRSFEFYIAARLLFQKGLYVAAAFTASQTIELLLKATLVYWDDTFNPKKFNHDIKLLVSEAQKKVPGAYDIKIPSYFSFENRFYMVTRYPIKGKGVGIEITFVSDLDKIFADLICSVPFQHNTTLKNALSGRLNNNNKLNALRRGNAEIRRIRKFLSA